MAGVVVTGWCLGEFMSCSTIQWQCHCGYGELGLMAFPLVCGVAGPTPVRFTTLPRAPRHSLAYAATLPHRTPSGTSGHNPLRSLAVLAMIAQLSAQAGSGLLIPSHDFVEYGPPAHWVSEDTVLSLTAWHYWLSRAILAVTVLHVTVIRFYLVWKRENPITPMITGWKWVKRDSHTDEHTRRADAGFVHHCQPTSPSVMPRTTPSTRRRRPSSGAARPVLLQACPHLYVASRNGFCASARPPRDKKNRNQALA
ncbi:MAG: cytochrome b/b6 domain-containing protein [Pseudomonadota bacterium]